MNLAAITRRASHRIAFKIYQEQERQTIYSTKNLPTKQLRIPITIIYKLN